MSKNVMEMSLKLPVDRNVRELDGKVMLELRDALDTRIINNVSAWRAFAAELEGRYQFR